MAAFGRRASVPVNPGGTKKAATPATPVTRKSVEDALAALRPTPPAAPSKADKERALRIAKATALILKASDEIVSLGIVESRDLAKAEASIKAFSSALKNAVAAIEAIPDSKLVDQEPKAPTAPKTERTPRAATESPAAATSGTAPGGFAPATAPERVDGDPGSDKGFI